MLKQFCGRRKKFEILLFFGRSARDVVNTVENVLKETFLQNQMIHYYVQSKNHALYIKPLARQNITQCVQSLLGWLLSLRVK